MNDTRIRAPELPSELIWFNCERPLGIADLRGRVSLVYFWSAGSLAAVSIQAELRRLEARFPDGLVAIGVHHPRFPAERQDTHLVKAINRGHIHHPVVHDPDGVLLRLFRVKDPSSLIYIDPEGFIVGVLKGVEKRHRLEKTIATHLQQVQTSGYPEAASLPLRRESEPASALQFPSKLFATAGRLYISDSGRNRIVETDHLGHVRRVFGSASPGRVDGSAECACFNGPQGLCKVEDDLYIADAGNHAIRRIRLASGEVETVAGMAGVLPNEGESRMLEHDLRFPWDLVYRDGTLYIATAGSHQLWCLTLNSLRLKPYAGLGRAALQDGTVRSAGFSLPSGLASYGEHLFVADAGNSAIRLIRLPTEAVTTLVGNAQGDSGDREGLAGEARLQYPLSIAIDRQRELLWIADTYNAKIKLLALKDQRLRAYPVTTPLDGPAGLDIIGDTLYIANTNAHQVIRVDLAKQTEQVLEIDEAG